METISCPTRNYKADKQFDHIKDIIAIQELVHQENQRECIVF